MISLLTFAIHKVNFCHQVQFFCFLFFFLLPEVSNNKPGVDGGNKLLNNLVAFLPNNLEILLVNAFVPLSFARHKVNLLSSSSVLYFSTT